MSWRADLRLGLDAFVGPEGEGHFATGRTRPRAGRLAMVAFWFVVTMVFPIVLTAMAVGQGLLTPWGGIRGTVTITACDLPSRTGKGCTGRFVSEREPRVVIDRVVVNETELFGRSVDIGDRWPARVSSQDAKHAFPAGFSLFAMLIPVLLAVTWFVGIWVLLAWPVRAVIHLFRPDVWPRWITAGPRSVDYRTWPFGYWFDRLPTRHPGWLRLLIRAAKVTAGVLGTALGALLVVFLIGLVWP